ncbi:MAG: hypothetical protein SW833_28250 [Cyanobacteriota bacterium]|nr:hypothetical protein [Cyanobacteriota bacterium]
MNDIYGNQDPRNIPNYTIGDAARYLKIPRATIRAWIVGREYLVVDGTKNFPPLIETLPTKPRLLSLRN